MWQSRQYEDPFTSPEPGNAPPATFKWLRTARSSRFSGLRITPMKLASLLLVFGVYIIIWGTFSNTSTELVGKPVENTTLIPRLALAALQPPNQAEPGQYRYPDTIDTFASYKFRSSCNISSLDLHAAFSPLCGSRREMIDAMSGGGRIGLDGRFMSRGCDMRWFTSKEVCEIIGRFDKVILVGDSMLRHLVGSINVLMRKDLGYGAVTDWNFNMQERRECFCNEQFDVKACSVQGIYKTADVLQHDPESLKCVNPVNVIMEQIVRYPIPAEELTRFKTSLTAASPLSTPELEASSSNSRLHAQFEDMKKPTAIIFGHGLWNNLDLQKTVEWFDTILDTITATLGNENWYGLFVTPNAAGKEKPDDWILTQGNKALCLFEEAVGLEVRKRHENIFAAGSGALEHLGTWNMSIQARKYDGVHLDMRGNLVKAMMTLNWLAMI